MTQTDPHLEALLLHLKESRGFDFTGYKRASLTRRVRRRMTQVGVGGFAEYRDYLQVHSDEFTLLFNAIFHGPSTPVPAAQMGRGSTATNND